MIRVAIADDQPLVRSGFAAQVAHAPDLAVAGEAANGEEAVALAVRERPDVLLMDVRMPVIDGIEATRRISSDERCGGVRVIVLTTFDLDEYIYGALRAGASGFLLKDVSPEELLHAVRVVAGGDSLLDPAVTKRFIERFIDAPSPLEHAALLGGLTEREREVLGLVGRGLTNAEIGEHLFVSAATAKTHVGRLLAKLHARDRVQLVVLAYESGLVRPGTPRG